jgi:hypothetical protein
MARTRLALLVVAVLVVAGALWAGTRNSGGPEPADQNLGKNVITPVAQRVGETMLYAPSEDDDPAFRAAIAGFTGGTVDYFDARAATPDVATLQGYDCVYTWVNYALLDAVGFGDNLADAVDTGTVVILGAFCTYTSGNSLSGRIMTAPYCPVVSPGGTNHFATSDYAGDGTTAIYTGVTAFECTFRDILTPQGSGIQDGSYVDGEIAHAYRPDFKVIYSNGTGALQLACTGDWARLVANACQAGVPVELQSVSAE